MRILIGVCFLSLGCTSTPVVKSHLKYCKELKSGKYSVLQVLDAIPVYYQGKCYHQVLKFAQAVRSQYTEKHWSISQELFSLFAPGGTSDRYTLESYERSHLSLYMALAYYKLDKFAEAKVELLRSYNELVAITYNSGIDEINLALMAILWEKLGDPDYSRPLWASIAENDRVDTKLRHFAKNHIRRIDQGRQEPLYVFKIGRLPTLDWSSQGYTQNSGFYKIHSHPPPHRLCYSKSSIRIPTDRWIDIFRQRYRADYHPYLNFKSTIRLPIGVLFTGATVASGVGIGVAGCLLAIKDDSGRVCETFIRIGAEIISQSPGVWNYVAQPDLRHWKNIPGSFVFSNSRQISRSRCKPSKARYWF